MRIYLIGSLENPRLPEIGNTLRDDGHTVFDDWFAGGPDADKEWRKYEEGRGRSFEEALKGEAANNIFQFDYRHLNESDAAVLVLPAGKSGHMELGYMIGSGKWGFILLDDSVPPKWDVMYCFAHHVTRNLSDLRNTILVAECFEKEIR